MWTNRQILHASFVFGTAPVKIWSFLWSENKCLISADGPSCVEPGNVWSVKFPRCPQKKMMVDQIRLTKRQRHTGHRHRQRHSGSKSQCILYSWKAGGSRISNMAFPPKIPTTFFHQTFHRTFSTKTNFPPVYYILHSLKYLSIAQFTWSSYDDRHHHNHHVKESGSIIEV